MEPVRTDTVTIKFDDGKWKIDPPVARREPGEPLKWVFDKSNAPVEAEEDKAYFQFYPDLLVTDDSNQAPVKYPVLIKAGQELKTKVINDDTLKRNEPYYYAIFIHDAFVEGHNPPPQIIVGP